MSEAGAVVAIETKKDKTKKRKREHGNGSSVGTGERGKGSIYKFGRIWWIQYYDATGRQRRESSHSKTYKVAEKLLLRRLAEKEAGTLPSHQAHNLTYENLRDAYYSEYQMLGRKSLRFSKEGKPRLDKVVRLDDFFKEHRVSQITTDRIREFILKLQRDELANQTINHSLAALRHMLRVAKRDGKVREIPYIPMLKPAPPRKGLLSHKKYPELLKSLPDYLQPVLALAYHTGMRRAEISNLKWSDVNFIERVIRLNAGETKNDSAREIPITDELKALLENQFVKRDPRCPFVCFRLDPRRNVLPIGDFRKVWKNRCAKLGIGDLRLHDLRRTFITDAEDAGAPRHEIMKITGHKTESVYRRYAIDRRERQRAAMNEIVAFRAKANGANPGQIEEETESEDSVTN